jgi:hypothetical protein
MRGGLAVAGTLYLLLIVAGQAAGVLNGPNLVAVVGFPLVLAVGLTAPRWALLGLLAAPPGYLLTAGVLDLRVLTTMLMVLTGLQAIRSRRLPGRILAYLLPLLGLVALSVTFIYEESTRALGPASSFRSLLVFAIALGVYAYVLVRDGEVTAIQIADAAILGVVLTAIVFMVQNNFQPWTYTTRSFGDALRPGLLGYRTHFGYVVCIGFCIAAARSAGVVGQRPRWGPAVTIFLGLMTIFSFTRGAWIAALLYLIALPLRTGRKGTWIVVALVVATALTFPIVQERLVSGASGGVGQAIQSGEFATGRWELWQELWERASDGLPAGNGFGFAFSLTPQELLGVEAFTSGRNAFVYPHNDFLYAALDLGYIGAALLSLMWIVVIGMYVKAKRTEAWLFGGVLLTMFIASLVDNGIFIRPVLERFIVAFAVIAAMYAARRRALPPA